MIETCGCGTEVIRMDARRMPDGSFRVEAVPFDELPPASVHAVEDGSEGVGVYEFQPTRFQGDGAGEVDLRPAGAPYVVEEMTWSEHTSDRCARARQRRAPERGPDGTEPGRVLVARCQNYREDVDRPCAGEVRFRWGQVQSGPCSECRGREGIAVAAWDRVEPAPPEPPVPPAAVQAITGAWVESSSLVLEFVLSADSPALWRLVELTRAAEAAFPLAGWQGATDVFGGYASGMRRVRWAVEYGRERPASVRSHIRRVLLEAGFAEADVAAALRV